MKKGLALIVLCLAALYVYGQSNTVVSLDEAIFNSVGQIQDSLERGSTIIVYQFHSQSERISDYVLKELFNLLVKSHKFIVLDRTAQEIIDAEIDFQFKKSAGMISDESLASLTQRIGAQAIVTGSLDDTASEYTFRIKVIGTETTTAVVSEAIRVNRNDKRVAAFENRRKSSADKVGTGALNIVLGLGSYLEGDIAGGITLTAGYVIAAGLFVIEAVALDWDNPAVGVPATIGAGVAGLTLVYGFVRPFVYNRSPQLASVMDNLQPGIVMTSGTSENGVPAFQLIYSVKF